jgi:hypothetical protein
MKRFLVCALAIGGLVALATAQPRDASVFTHGYNNVPAIKAYHLSAAQEAQFSNADNKRSCFWLAWELPTATRLDSAMTEGGAANTGWGPIETPDDETVIVKMAWGTAGLYVLYQVIDDAWIGYVSPIDYENDCCELFLDPHSAQALYGAGTPYFTAVDISQLTETYDQFQIRFGGNEPVEQFSLNWWNPSVVGTGCTQPPQCVLYQRNLTFPEADLTWGMKIEIIPPAGNETNIRRQEWMIPWALYGQPPGKATPPAESDRLAMCYGYNDRDDGLEPSASAIRWRNASDPYTTAIDPSTSLTTTVDSWGEVQFVGDLNTAANVTDQQINQACIDVGCKHPLVNAMKQFKVQNTQYFTLAGQRVSNLNTVPSRTIVLERSVLSNGTVNVKRIVRK